MSLDDILMQAEEAMEKAMDHLKHELRGLRTGRASTALVEFVKVDYYGTPTELRQLASLTTPEATQILIKPFDASSVQAIIKGIQEAGLGLNPMGDGKAVRINIPSLSGDRRKQLVGNCKQFAEQAKVVIRNARRDANKHVDALAKDKTQHLSEDQIEQGKEEVQELLKKYEKLVDDTVALKQKEIEAV
jgi:ribosome recycling factor